MTKLPIKTLHDPKPLPSRVFDWQAWYEGDEPDDDGMIDCGYGPTEARAIQDLLDNFSREKE